MTPITSEDRRTRNRLDSHDGRRRTLRTSSVDILLPTHRRPHTLAYSIQSVLAQTHCDFQLHVIGDGSGDETESVVRSFHDSRIRFYRFSKAPGFGTRSAMRSCGRLPLPTWPT